MAQENEVIKPLEIILDALPKIVTEEDMIAANVNFNPFTGKDLRPFHSNKTTRGR